MRGGGDPGSRNSGSECTGSGGVASRPAAGAHSERDAPGGGIVDGGGHERVRPKATKEKRRTGQLFKYLWFFLVVTFKKSKYTQRWLDGWLGSTGYNRQRGQHGRCRGRVGGKEKKAQKQNKSQNGYKKHCAARVAGKVPDVVAATVARSAQGARRGKGGGKDIARGAVFLGGRCWVKRGHRMAYTCVCFVFFSLFFSLFFMTFFCFVLDCFSVASVCDSVSCGFCGCFCLCVLPRHMLDFTGLVFFSRRSPKHTQTQHS